MTALQHLWTQLRRIRSLAFVARSEAETGWNGKGSGSVVVQEEVVDAMLTFSEAGVWRSVQGRDLRFTNVFRWSVVGERLRLEHLRFGVDRPVHLFDLAQTREREWHSVSPHLCREDCYAAVLIISDDHLVLRWTIDGPRKRETIEYVYSFQESAS